MIKARFIWYFNIVLAIAALVIAFRLWYVSKQDAWNYIPDNAFMVIESSTLQESLYKSNDAEAKKLADIPFFYDAIQQLQNLSKGTDKKDLYRQFLQKKLITYSLHRDGKKNLSFITYIPIKRFSDEVFIDLLQNPTDNKTKIFSHESKGFKIYELFENNNQLITYYFVHNDFMVCSKSSVLLEEVIGNLKSNAYILDKTPFKQSRLGQAHLYLNSKKLADISELLPSKLSPNLLNFLSNVSPNNPDMVVEHSKFPQTISAYLYSLTKKDIPFLNLFNNQKSKPFGATKLIPENTSILIRLAFNDTKALRINFNEYLRSNDPVFNELKDSVNRHLDIDINTTFSLLKDEAVFCEMETVTDEASKKIVLLNTSNITGAIKKLDDFSTIAENLTPNFQHKPFSYLNFYVRKLEINQFPALLFGGMFQGFPHCYYTQASGYIVLANSEEAMKDFLTNLSSGQTWDGLSIYSDFVKKLNTNAQVTAIISPQRTWNNIYHSLQGDWQKAYQEHELRAKGMRLIAYENQVVNSKYGARILIEKSPIAKEAVLNQLFIQDSLMLPKPIVGSPILMYNPDTNQDEILIGNAENQISLLAANNQLINTQTIDSKLKETLFPIDFYHNGRLQYLGQSNNAVYIFNRHNKNGLEIFKPNIALKGEIKALTATASKLYVGDANGQLFAIEGATQKIIKIPTPRPFLNILDIKTVSFKNNIYLAIVQRDGTLSVINESGTVLKGFPVVPLHDRPINMISNPDEIILISETGEIKSIGVDGVSKEFDVPQIERPNKITKFEILFDQKQNDWLIIRRTPTDITVFDKHGKSLIIIANTNTLGTKLKLFDLGNDLRIIALFDGQRNSLFDLRGKQLGNNSLQASNLPYLSYLTSYNKLFIYNPNGTKFETWTIKVK